MGLDRGQDNIPLSGPGHLCCAVEVAFLLGPWWPPADSEQGRDCLRGTLASVSGWNRKAKDRLGRGELGLSKGVAVGMGGGWI